MSPFVADRIAGLTAQQVRLLAVREQRHLRFRWDGDAEFWHDFLIAADEADEGRLAVLRHQAKLRFCGESLRPGTSAL
jgi:hypothetical protein